MKPISWDWDYLIHRHLEGAATGEQRRALNERLKIDARLRRRLAELAYEQALYGVLLGGRDPGRVLGSPSLAAPLLKPASPDSLLKLQKKHKGRKSTRRRSPGDSELGT